MVDPEHRGADEQFDMPPGYEGLHGMVECPNCGAHAQYKPGMDQTSCEECGSDLSV